MKSIVQEPESIMNDIKHKLKEQLIVSGVKYTGVERLSKLSHSTIARMFDETDPSVPDLPSLIAVVKIIGGSLDKICGLISDDVPMDASAQIADKAMSAYSELLTLKDTQLADKDKQICDKDRQIARYETIIDLLTQQLEEKRDRPNDH